MKLKIGRNEPCRCGSGKKFKRCCGRDSATCPTVELGGEPPSICLDYDSGKREAALKNLLALEAGPSLDDGERINVRLLIAQAYQQLGQHSKALTTLNAIIEDDCPSDELYEAILLLGAISQRELGDIDAAVESSDVLLEKWIESPPSDDARREVGLHLIEVGKTYRAAEQIGKARECWQRSDQYLADFNELEHQHRAKSNLAILDMNDDDPVIQERGVTKLEDLIGSKLATGDIQGAASNYCNLGNYYRKKKRYSRAIAYYRKDMSLSRMVGNKRELAITLGNFATLYTEMKQLKQARAMLREARKIGEALGDKRLLYITEHQQGAIDKTGREAGISGQPMGAQAPCLCDSGNVYSGCCGLADFEPIELPMQFGGLSGDVEALQKEFTEAGKKEISRLDFLLRQSPESERRRAWTRIHINDGWMEVHELPDMANIHLISAKSLVTEDDPENSSANALSAVILSVCHLEAFINQISFFLHEHHKEGTDPIVAPPPELLQDGPLSYQRGTSLESKWLSLIGSMLGEGWLERQAIWKEVQDLIYIRNELVHFKSAGYEQVIPPPTERHPIYGRIPAHLATYSRPHSWPIRAITLELATWAVDTAERLVKEVRAAYRSTRTEVCLQPQVQSAKPLGGIRTPGEV